MVLRRGRVKNKMLNLVVREFFFFLNAQLEKIVILCDVRCL